MNEAVDLRATQKRDTRRRLVGAARALFGEHGVAAVTIDQIARTAGTSRANFYLHFAGKDEVLHEMRREMWQMALGWYEAFAALPDVSEPALLGWLRQVARAWRRDGAITRIVLGATPHQVELEYEAQLARYVAALTRDASKWSGFSAAEARARAYLLVVQLERCLNDQDHIALPVERGLVLRELAAIWAATLRAPVR